MKTKQEKVSIIVFGVMLLLGFEVVINALAQAPQQAQIAFHSTRDGKYNYEIYVMDTDGSNQTRLTDNPKADWFPSWSPDGRRIAFTSNRDGKYAEIYVMDADGSNQTRLTDNRKDDCIPCWSPDGQSIAFNSYRDGNYEIYVMDADGSNQRNLTNNPAYDSSPDWKKPPCGNIEGYVTDRLTGMPLKNAVIIAKKLSGDIIVKAISYRNGYYKLRCLQPGTWLLVCVRRDYHRSAKVVKVKPVETTTCDFMLRPSVEEDVFELLDSYPNPCNPETWIPYRLPQDSEVTIRIYSATGQLVRTMNLGRQTAGAYLNKNKAAYWNGRNDGGSQVASGVYFYTLKVGKFTATRKMMLLK